LSFRDFLPVEGLWHDACSGDCGATRYQVVNSTDGVSGHQGEEDDRTYQALATIPRLPAPFSFSSQEFPDYRKSPVSKGAKSFLYCNQSCQIM